jgi:signal transduction histidine kinase
VTRARLVPLAVVVIGGALSIGAAAAASMSTSETVKLCGLAAGTGLIAVLIGSAALRALRTRPVGTQVAAVALTTVVALMFGAYAAAEAMFISAHDLSSLLVVLLAAGTVGVAASFVLGARVERASNSLVEVARRIGRGEPTTAGEPVGGPEELTRLGIELGEMERRLDETQQRERTLERSRRELIGWVSHDLRTPLAGIRAMAEALEDGVVEDPATVARYHRRLREEADHLAALVDDLFELSRTHAGALRLRYSSVSLADLVSDALSGSAPVAAAKGVHLVGRMVGPPPEIEASAPEVLRVLRNLLENAIRYTPSDGSVVVEAGVDAARPDCVYVSVRDDGGGVPEADLPRIFDVGYQGDPARGSNGAGLGLAIAKGFADAHQGELTVGNENGGARFTLRLPQERTP